MAERTCAMVVVGNEILSGKVQDSNACFAARELRKLRVVELRRVAAKRKERRPEAPLLQRQATTLETNRSQ